MAYLGSKAQAGVFQRIISQMPPHSYYIEPFFGSGQIFFRKKPAVRNVIIDADAGVIAKIAAMRRRPSADPALLQANVVHGDAIQWLQLHLPAVLTDTVIYCDPPYLLSTRTSRHRYNHEFSDDQHAALLALLDAMSPKYGPCILLSGYPSKLYSERLKNWRCISYRTRTRGRTLTECLWCNQPEPVKLHDWSYFGNDCRERLNLKRYAARFIARLERLSPAKRNYVLDIVDQRQFQHPES